MRTGYSRSLIWGNWQNEGGGEIAHGEFVIKLKKSGNRK